MTDSEIIKFSKHSVIKHCDNCPYEQYHYQPQLEDETRDLIDRQKAEIDCLQKELLKKMYDFETEYDSKIKAEAIKEFWNELKKRNTMDERIVSVATGDNLVKEMVGDSDD